MTWAMVLVGGAVGAPLRYLVDRAVQARHDAVFPWGTFTANMLGCVILGFLAGATTVAAVPVEVQSLVGVGLAGALSTYSTFSFESVRLAETGSPYFALANAMVSVVAGLGTAYAAGALALAVLG